MLENNENMLFMQIRNRLYIFFSVASRTMQESNKKLYGGKICPLKKTFAAASSTFLLVLRYFLSFTSKYASITGYR